MSIGGRFDCVPPKYENTDTSCGRFWPSNHIWVWDDKPGWMICECGMKYWNPCKDKRVFPDEP